MTDAADRLMAMAARIKANNPDEFAGCIVIIPPVSQDGRAGESIELLLIDPKRDPANFWSTVKAKAEIGEAEFVQAHQRPNLGFR
jgi:hypothetical protein